MTATFATFGDFWPYYLRQHASEDTRNLHFFGTAAALTLLGGVVFHGDYRWLCAAIVVAYASAWLGHFMFEKNRPATFTHPLWSLRGDFRMFRLWVLGRLDTELEKAGVQSN
jgi:hypothetical protein